MGGAWGGRPLPCLLFAILPASIRDLRIRTRARMVRDHRHWEIRPCFPVSAPSPYLLDLLIAAMHDLIRRIAFGGRGVFRPERCHVGVLLCA